MIFEKELLADKLQIAGFSLCCSIGRGLFFEFWTAASQDSIPYTAEMFEYNLYGTGDPYERHLCQELEGTLDKEQFDDLICQMVHRGVWTLESMEHQDRHHGTADGVVCVWSEQFRHTARLYRDYSSADTDMTMEQWMERYSGPASTNVDWFLNRMPGTALDSIFEQLQASPRMD